MLLTLTVDTTEVFRDWPIGKFPADKWEQEEALIEALIEWGLPELKRDFSKELTFELNAVSAPMLIGEKPCVVTLRA